MEQVQYLAEAEDAAGDQIEAQNPPIPLEVIILYEDLDSGRQARRACRYLAGSLRGVCAVKSRSWKFNLLEHPRLQSILAHDAAEADILIVASQGCVALPEAVRTWIELWAGSKVSAIGLVGLFQHPENAAVVRDYLEEVARKSGLEFFTEPGAASRRFVLSPFAFAN